MSESSIVDEYVLETDHPVDLDGQTADGMRVEGVEYGRESITDTSFTGAPEEDDSRYKLWTPLDPAEAAKQLESGSGMTNYGSDGGKYRVGDGEVEVFIDENSVSAYMPQFSRDTAKSVKDAVTPARGS